MLIIVLNVNSKSIQRIGIHSVVHFFILYHIFFFSKLLDHGVAR